MEKGLEGGRGISSLPERGQMMTLGNDLQFSLVFSICHILKSLFSKNGKISASYVVDNKTLPIRSILKVY